MAPLTWREVSAPNFSGVSDSQRTAALLLDRGLGGLSDAVGAFGKSRMDQADSQFLAGISRFTDPAALQAALRNGTALGGIDPSRISPEALKFGIGMQDDLIGNEGASLNNRNQELVNDQTGWNNQRSRVFSDFSLEATAAGAEDARLGRANTQAARNLIASLAPTAIDQNDLLRKVRASNASPDILAAAVGLAEGQGPAIFGGNADPSSVVLSQLVDQTEGAGNYSTLFGNSQKDGGQFAGYDVSTKTLGQLKEFAAPSGAYGQWVKGQTGKDLPSTPMGRFQIVGSTMADVAKEMGLPDDTVFDENTQKAMFNHLVDRRLTKATTLDGKMAELRKEWEGFKNVPDTTLAQAIRSYESGNSNALAGVGGQANPAAASIAAAAGNQALINQGTLLQNQATELTDTATADAAFDQSFPILTTLMQPEGKEKTSSEAAAELATFLTDIPIKTLTTDINETMRRNKVSADVAAAAIKNAVSENTWFGDLNFSGNDRFIPQDIVDQHIAEFINPGTGKPLAGTLEQIEVRRTKQAAQAKLSDLNARVEQAKQEYFNAVARQQDRPSVDVSAPKKRYEALLGQLQLEIAATNQNPLIRANTSSNSAR